MPEHHRYRLTVVTPLHIGSGEVLSRLDYVHLGRYLYILDPAKLGRALVQRGLLEPFLEQVESQGRGFSVSGFLQRHGLHNEGFYRSLLRYKLESTTAPPELHTFIRNAQGLPYLPGSSLKGAFRVALVYRLLKQAPEEVRERLLIEPVRQELQDLQRLRHRDSKKYKRRRYTLQRNFAREIHLEANLLQNFQLPNARQGPNTDLLRVWQVQDSEPLETSTLRVYGVSLVSLSGSSSRTPLAVEALKPGTTQEVTFTLHTDLLEDFRRHNPRPRSGISWDLYDQVLRNPLETLADFTRDLLEHERRNLKHPAFERARNLSDAVNLRLGWGQGLLSTTVVLLLPPDLRGRLYQEILNPRGRRQPSADIPLTRRLADSQLMGFARLEPA